jgi:hypothetical protein
LDGRNVLVFGPLRHQGLLLFFSVQLIQEISEKIISNYRIVSDFLDVLFMLNRRVMWLQTAAVLQLYARKIAVLNGAPRRVP